MAAYTALTPEDAVVYKKVKKAILRRYEISEETYRQRFRQDCKKGEKSYRQARRKHLKGGKANKV